MNASIWPIWAMLTRCTCDCVCVCACFACFVLLAYSPGLTRFYLQEVQADWLSCEPCFPWPHTEPGLKFSSDKNGQWELLTDLQMLLHPRRAVCELHKQFKGLAGHHDEDSVTTLRRMALKSFHGFVPKRSFVWLVRISAQTVYLHSALI